MGCSTPWCIKELELVSVEAPSKAVKPGGTVNVKVTVRNTASVILFNDPDRCDEGTVPGSTLTGYLTNIHVSIAGLSVDQTKTECIPMGGVGNRISEYWFQFTAPQAEGNYVVSGDLELLGSGLTTDDLSTDFTVSESGDQEPPVNGETPDGDGDAISRLIDFLETLPWVVSLVAIAIIIKSITDVFD